LPLKEEDVPLLKGPSTIEAPSELVNVSPTVLPEAIPELKLPEIPSLTVPVP
jgi:hypothetical protein